MPIGKMLAGFLIESDGVKGDDGVVDLALPGAQRFLKPGLNVLLRELDILGDGDVKNEIGVSAAGNHAEIVGFQTGIHFGEKVVHKNVKSGQLRVVRHHGVVVRNAGNASWW